MGEEKKFTCPLDCLAGVGEVFSGQYDIPATIHAGTFRMLDIGANCGAFALWARRRWPQAEIICYEPQPDIFAYLQANTAHDDKITCCRAAVGDPALTRLMIGDNRLCSSQYNIGRQTAKDIAVQVLPPSDLPPCDLMKIDTEGAEGYIIEHLATAGHLPSLLVVEYHTEELRQRIERALASVPVRVSPCSSVPSYSLLRCEILGRGWGHLTYAKQEVLS